MSQAAGAITRPASPEVVPFFDEPTNTLSYVVKAPGSRQCVVVDPVLDLDYPSGSVHFTGARRIVDYIRSHDLELVWILETHVHADHLSSAAYLKQALGGTVAIGSQITVVQEIFGEVFAAGPGFAVDGSQFDRLLADGDSIEFGGLVGRALHTPGHTPACMTYVLGDAVFVGDTLFMPDGGTARVDFPGGDAATLYQSIQRILAMPPDTRIFVCHDYLPNGRELEYETSVEQQLQSNIHVHTGIDVAEFTAMREARDATLGMPTLILPSLQVNMRGGHFPPAGGDGRTFLNLPVNAFGGDDITGLASAEAGS